MDEYIYPVSIEYDRKLLYQTCLDIKHWPRYTADKGKTFFSTHRDIVFPISFEAIRIKNRFLDTTTYSFSYVPPGHDTGWHTDETRGCTLILPIDDTPHLIRFRIDGEEVDYHYDSPVVTNAKTWHNGINYSTVPRYNLLFHFDKSYREVVGMVKDGTLETKWKQDYNICQMFDSSMVARYFSTHSDVDACDILITDDLEIADKHQDKHIIFIGEQQARYATILISGDTKHRDIVQAIKYMLDSPCSIQCISIR